MNFWERKHIPLDRALFYYLEKLVLQSWDSRVLGILYSWLATDGVAIEHVENIKKHLTKLTALEFYSLVEGIRCSAFIDKAWSPSDISDVATDQVDKEFL